MPWRVTEPLPSGSAEIPAPAPAAGTRPPRRPRYAGRNPRRFEEKYKERDPAKYAADVAKGLAETRAFIADVWTNVSAGARAGKDLNTVYRETYEKLKPKYGQWVIFDHCMPFDVTRAYDEATGYRDPRIWTAERDIDMWKTLET